MSRADRLLERLQGVRRTGPGRWLARCPAHKDRSPSLSVRELDDGRVLLHDFAGCSAAEIVAAAGLTLADLMPERAPDAHRAPREARPYTARDVVRALRHELTTAHLVLGDLAAGLPVTDSLRIRAGQARERIAALVSELAD